MGLTFIELIKSQLVGKKLKHKNEHNREVTLEVEDITTKSGSTQITPDTAANDWWGQSVDWTKNYVHFVDGSKIEFDTATKFEIVE